MSAMIKVWMGDTFVKEVVQEGVGATIAEVGVQPALVGSAVAVEPAVSSV